MCESRCAAFFRAGLTFFILCPALCSHTLESSFLSTPGAATWRPFSSWTRPLIENSRFSRCASLALCWAQSDALVRFTKQLDWGSTIGTRGHAHFVPIVLCFQIQTHVRNRRSSARLTHTPYISPHRRHRRTAEGHQRKRSPTPTISCKNSAWGRLEHMGAMYQMCVYMGLAQRIFYGMCAASSCILVAHHGNRSPTKGKKRDIIRQPSEGDAY